MQRSTNRPVAQIARLAAMNATIDQLAGDGGRDQGFVQYLNENQTSRLVEYKYRIVPLIPDTHSYYQLQAWVFLSTYLPEIF